MSENTQCPPGRRQRTWAGAAADGDGFLGPMAAAKNQGGRRSSQRHICIQHRQVLITACMVTCNDGRDVRRALGRPSHNDDNGRGRYNGCSGAFPPPPERASTRLGAQLHRTRIRIRVQVCHSTRPLLWAWALAAATAGDSSAHVHAPVSPQPGKRHCTSSCSLPRHWTSDILQQQQQQQQQQQPNRTVSEARLRSGGVAAQH